MAVFFSSARTKIQFNPCFILRFILFYGYQPHPSLMPLASLPKPNFTVCFEPNNMLLRITWQGEVTAADLQVGYETALELLRTNPVTRILIDMSRRKLNMPGSPDPLFGKMFQEALKLIGSTVFLALVMSQEDYFLNSEVSRFGYLREAQNDYIITESFLTRQEAETWLATQH